MPEPRCEPADPTPGPDASVVRTAKLKPLTGDAAIAAGAGWKLSDQAKRDIQAIEDNVAMARAMAPFLWVR